MGVGVGVRVGVGVEVGVGVGVGGGMHSGIRATTFAPLTATVAELRHWYPDRAADTV